MNAGSVFLESYLDPLRPFLIRADVTDIYVQRPGEVWIECVTGVTERHSIKALDDATLWRLSRQVAALTHQGVSRAHPILSASLPDGARIQIVVPPATRGDIALAIRKHVLSDMSLADYAQQGAFTFTHVGSQPDDATKTALVEQLERHDLAGFLRDAVRARCNILISGGTSSGKTTFLNALIKEIPSTERLILIEDTAELQIHHPNAVGLVAAKSDLGEAQVTIDDLLQASLRMRPDRILQGELRGKEAYSFLRAVNTGHPGSMTTIHADSPTGAVEQLCLMVLQAGTELTYDAIRRYVERVIDIFIHLDRRAGKREVRAVTFRGYTTSQS